MLGQGRFKPPIKSRLSTRCSVGPRVGDPGARSSQEAVGGVLVRAAGRAYTLPGGGTSPTLIWAGLNRCSCCVTSCLSISRSPCSANCFACIFRCCSFSSAALTLRATWADTHTCTDPRRRQAKPQPREGDCMSGPWATEVGLGQLGFQLGGGGVNRAPQNGGGGIWEKG